MSEPQSGRVGTSSTAGSSVALSAGQTAPPGWTDKEITLLAEVAETFVRGAATRRANLAANSLVGAVDPDRVRQLRRALRMFDSRLANLVLTGRPARFHDLSATARQAYLLGWAGSRFARRRSAFQALKRLLCFLAYADPGDRMPNPRLAAIGYRPIPPTLTAQPSSIEAARLPPPGAGNTIEIDADVVIVGSGAGGSVMAAELAQAGRSVVVLEAGELIREPEMPTDELSAFNRLFLDHGLTSTRDGSIAILAGSVVGGGTLVNWTTCVPPPGHVRADWSRAHGIEGFDDAELASDLAALEEELGVTEPTAIPPKDAAILRGAAILGVSAGPTVRNTDGCADCGTCTFGCRRGSKRSAIRAHLQRAALAGARIVPRTTVARVLIEGGRATGVEGLVRVADDRELVLRVRAQQVVVAAGALRTPSVLARSGVGHPALGRHLHLHPTPVIGARYLDPVDMWAGPLQAAASRAGVAPAEGSAGYVVESAPGHPGLIALAFPWESTEGHAGMMERARFFAPMIAVCSDLDGGRVTMNRSGRVSIEYTVSQRDATTMRHALDAMARLGRAAGAIELVALGTPPSWYQPRGMRGAGETAAFEQYLGALRTFDFAPGRGMVFSAHQMGTARMGAAAADHVCDPDGRVRSSARSGRSGADSVVRGLYVADSSLFPTALGVNPMLTVMALARRVARTVRADEGASRG